MSHGKQFTLYTHNSGANGWKVAFVLEELGLTYESIFLDFSKGEHKAPSYTKYNPNGRIPALIDHHNGDYIIWESNAILLYLVDKYDSEKRLTIADEKEKATLIQWLLFQASGQGPYFGQAIWFIKMHPENLPSAIKRYTDETRRVLSVLDSVLSGSASGYLVGGKPTIADLSFVTGNIDAMERSLTDVDFSKEYPALWAWHSKVIARDAVKKVLSMRKAKLQQ